MQVLSRNLIALALGAALVAPAVYAQSGSGMVATPTASSTSARTGNWWQNADTDGDGKLSSTEANANAGLASRFAAIDADRDGFVTSVEYRTFYFAHASQGEQRAAAHSAVVTRDVWATLDTDADSRISLAEAAGNADLAATFATMDSNIDGFVTQDEYTAHIMANK